MDEDCPEKKKTKTAAFLSAVVRLNLRLIMLKTLKEKRKRKKRRKMNEKRHEENQDV